MVETLTDVTQAIRACQHCAARFAATKTAHEPRPLLRVSETARLCIAGQAPGLRAHNLHQTFADPSGERLRAWMGLDAEHFYDDTRISVIPMAFCFPGYNANNHDLPPPKDCAALWRARLFEAMPQIELIVTVGKAALGWHRPELRSKSLTEIVSGGLSDGSPPVLPLPHPSWRNNAWLKGNPWFETQTLPFLRAEVVRLTTP
jgi:uracil-DNA glycosylase